MADITFLATAPAIPGSATAGAGVYVGKLNGFTASLEGAFTGTYQLQISLDTAATPAAASWLNEGTALTAPGVVQCTKQAAWARWNCTAFTSAPTTCHLAGVNRV